MSHLTDEEMTALALVFGDPAIIGRPYTSERQTMLSRFRAVISELFPRLPRARRVAGYQLRPEKHVSVSLTFEIFTEYQAWYEGNGGAGSHSSPAKRGHTDH